MTAPLTLVYQPLTIGDCTIPNRIARTAHATGLARGSIDEAFTQYHEARARGGVGLTILEIASVHPSSPAGINSWDDSIVDSYTSLASRLHDAGTAVFQQLWHGGHHAVSLDGSPNWSASDVPSPKVTVPPVPMTKLQIDEIVDCFAQATRRARDGGLDGVEIHCAHGYLINQFLSPLTNRRTDEYGGSFENRMRFAEEVLRAARQAVGTGFPIGVRLSGDEGVPGGIGPQDAAAIARRLTEGGLVDFVDVSLGGYHSFPKMIGGMHEPHGYELPTSTTVTGSVSVPTIVTGRITTLAEAEEVLASGTADIISMVRATLADPNLVRKTRDGRASEVRPCIGCNQGCVGGLFGPMMQIGCTVNPAAAQETALGDITLAASPRSVLVVGGGPAGLEAARVAAVRGHRVGLHEAAPVLGGQLRFARSAPHRDEIGAFADWCASELERLGVEVVLGSTVDPSLIEALDPDVTVIATGSMPRNEPMQAARPGEAVAGLEQARTCTSTELLSGEVHVPTTAVVLDDVGHYEAIGVAEYLLERGASVTFVTRFDGFGHLVEDALQAEPARQRLAGRPFTLLARSHLVALGSDKATVRGLAGGEESLVPAELTVLVTGSTSQRSLGDACAAAGVPFHLVGDAVAPRFLQTAIHEAHAVARGL